MERLRRDIFDGPAVCAAYPQKLAQRCEFDIARSSPLNPGEIAPTDGVYSEHNVFGTPTGKMVDVCEGESMPLAPVGFTWLPETPKLP